MGRKRVSNPRVSFSISVDKILLDKLNHRLAYNQSRSRWIADAIRTKIDVETKGSELMDHVTTDDLLSELLFRSMDLPISKLEREAIRSMKTKCRDLPESDSS
jgi:hypothetical protein